MIWLRNIIEASAIEYFVCSSSVVADQRSTRSTKIAVLGGIVRTKQKLPHEGA
jgi:hypothetical protein